MFQHHGCYTFKLCWNPGVRDRLLPGLVNPSVDAFGVLWKLLYAWEPFLREPLRMIYIQFHIL